MTQQRQRLQELNALIACGGDCLRQLHLETKELEELLTGYENERTLIKSNDEGD